MLGIGYVFRSSKAYRLGLYEESRTSNVCNPVRPILNHQQVAGFFPHVNELTPYQGHDLSRWVFEC